MTLTEVAKTLKERAVAKPANVAPAVEKILSSEEGEVSARKMLSEHQMEFEYKGYDLFVTFTLDDLFGHHAWHLSIGTARSDLDVPDRLCEEIVPHFLPGKGKQMRLPSMHGNKVKQFLEIID